MHCIFVYLCVGAIQWCHVQCSVQSDEDDVVSGWGELEEEVEEKEELSRKWGVLLDDWEAKSGSLGHRPKELTELCRKVGTY